MSYTTNVVLYVDNQRDKGLPDFLELMSQAERFGDPPRKIDNTQAGGTRLFTAAVYLLGSNHFPTYGLQDMLDAVTWTSPDKVVVLYTSEDGSTEVLRPHYVRDEPEYPFYGDRGKVRQVRAS